MENPFRRIAFRVMYDGTDFLGWQRQARGRTVQGELERLLSRLNGDIPVTVVGAGRTDSGVHAHGQVAHADISTRYDDHDLLYTLRRMSPDDMSLYDLRTVADDFHARFSALERTYLYRILLYPDPFLARYGWPAPASLDLRLLNRAASMLMGTHDFTALSKHNPDTPNPVCTIYRSEWIEEGGHLYFYVTANRFLYGMVRLLVGIQYDVGRGALDVEEIPAIIASADRARQSPAVPAKGLSLLEVSYEP